MRRATYSAGQRWRKWEDPIFDPRFPIAPWWEFREGQIGFLLICASIGGLLAVLVR